jgi:hypothetical protein
MTGRERVGAANEMPSITSERSELMAALFAKKRSHAITLTPRLGLDQPIVAQNSDPRIPMPTARLLAERRRQFVGMALSS